MNILRFLIPKSHVACLEDTNSLRNGLEKMHNRGYTAIPVIDKNGVYMGTVTEGDFLWYIMDAEECSHKSLEKNQVSRLIRPGFNPPVKASETVMEVFSKLKDQNFVPVVDDRGVFVGIVTRRAILEHCTFEECKQAPHPLADFTTL
ncbi:MAG: CBS domain-containing protein [Ruminococcaceae bacterium]|nr:CBS domain-containing protein [Oscillospiraceae bacterium]MBQ8324818.1 CBS domain-containing protein [Clostridia bacterium]